MVTGRAGLERQSASRYQAPTMTLLMATDTKSLGKTQMLQKHLEKCCTSPPAIKGMWIQATLLSPVRSAKVFCSFAIQFAFMCQSNMRSWFTRVKNGPTGTQDEKQPLSALAHRTPTQAHSVGGRDAN